MNDIPFLSTDEDPLFVRVQLNDIMGRIKFGVNKNFFTLSFFSIPDITKTKIKSSFPWWMPGINELVMYRLHRVLRNRLVQPNQRTFEFWKPRLISSSS